jgi:hypothetical protein
MRRTMIDIDYEPLKDQRPAVALHRPEAIPCESRERAMTIKTSFSLLIP